MKLKLEKPVYGGDCLGRVEGITAQAGKAVFVPLTLPGETVAARLIEEKRTFAKAELEEVLAASPHRVTPECRHFGICGGCHYQHADYPTQLAMKQQILRETLERAAVKFPSQINTLAANPAGEQWTYRNRIRLALAPDGRYGYRGRGSHTIVPIAECPIAAPLLLSVGERVAACLSKSPSPAPITEMELFTNHDESQLLLTLYCESPQPIGDWLGQLAKSLPAKVVGIRIQQADGGLEPKVLASAGSSSLAYTAAGFSYHVEHGAFFQVNRWLVDDFISLVTNGAKGQQAWDLYAGVGLFARPLTASFAQVVAVEVAGASFAALQQNLANTTGNAISSTTLDFLRHNRLERELRPDFLVLDPPRAGLGEEVTQLLNAIHTPQIVYVSCDPTTLARDLRALTQERYRIDSITQVDMFPQTFHMETVVRLVRA